MNINPANPTTTRTSATRSGEFRRVRRSATTVCNERVFSAERNTNCALTPFPVLVALNPPFSPSPRPARADTFAGAGFGIHPRNERLLQRSERVRRYIPFPLAALYPIPLDHPFRRCILPRASVVRARGTFSRRERATRASGRASERHGNARATRHRLRLLPGGMGERARDIMRRFSRSVYTRQSRHTYRAPMR